MCFLHHSAEGQEHLLVHGVRDTDHVEVHLQGVALGDEPDL